MHRALRKMCRMPVAIEKYLGQDGAGDTTYDEPYVALGFLDGKVTIIRGVSGEEVTSEEMLVLPPEINWLNRDGKDKITLPDGREPSIHAVKNLRDEKTRLHHIEIYL